MSSLNDPQHWLARAAEKRRIASQVADPLLKAIICKIADEYEQLAERAAKRKQEQNETERRQGEIAALLAASIGGIVALRAST